MLLSLPDPDALPTEVIKKLPRCDWSHFENEMDAISQMSHISGRDDLMEAVRSLQESPSPDTAAAATIWLAFRSVEEVISEGAAPKAWDNLLRSLESGFGDVAAAAIQACSMLMNESDSEALRRKGRAYSKIAFELADPVALVEAADRMSREVGDVASAAKLYEQAVEALDGPVAATLYVDTPMRANRGLLWCQVESEPDLVRSWFRQTQDACHIEYFRRVLVESNPQLLVDGYFNVESGQAGVAPRIFGNWDDEGIDAATRQIDGYFCVTSGDGVYPVIKMSDAEGMSAVAVLHPMSMDPWFELLRIVTGAAPLILGEFNSNGPVFFADANMSFNAPYVALDADAGKPSGYLVVAWVAPSPIFGSLRPAALGAVSGRLAQLLKDSLPSISAGERHDLVRSMWGDPGLLVSTHARDMALQAVAANLDRDNSDSWLIFLAECFDEDGEGARDALANEPLVLDDNLTDALERRGLRTLSLRWWSPTGDPESDALCQSIIAAGHPATALSKICELAQHPSRWVRRQLASRDDVPDFVLAALSHDSDEFVRTLVAGHSKTPVSALDSLSKDPLSDVRGAVASNPVAPDALLENMVKRGEFLQSIAANSNTRSRTQAALEERFMDHDNVTDEWEDYEGDDLEQYLEARFADLIEPESIRAIVAGNPSCPPGLLRLLATDEDCRFNVADNTACPSDLLTELAKDQDCHIAIARNPASPPTLLVEVAGDLNSFDLKFQLASNPACPVNLLVDLANDESCRSEVARNPSCPQELLAELAEYEDCRESLAENPSCPVALFPLLAGDDDCCFTVAENPSCPPTLLVQLATLNHLAGHVASNRSCPPDLITQLAVSDPLGVARNPSCPAELLEEFARRPDDLASTTLASFVAGNPSSPAPLLLELATRESLRAKIACNPSCPPQLLKMWTNDDGLRHHVAGNPSCPPELLAELAEGA